MVERVLAKENYLKEISNEVFTPDCQESYIEMTYLQDSNNLLESMVYTKFINIRASLDVKNIDIDYLKSINISFYDYISQAFKEYIEARFLKIEYDHGRLK